jgi:hypothetical protein
MTVLVARFDIFPLPLIDVSTAKPVVVMKIAEKDFAALPVSASFWPLVILVQR